MTIDSRRKIGMGCAAERVVQPEAATGKELQAVFNRKLGFRMVRAVGREFGSRAHPFVAENPESALPGPTGARRTKELRQFLGSILRSLRRLLNNG